MEKELPDRAPPLVVPTHANHCSCLCISHSAPPSPTRPASLIGLVASPSESSDSRPITIPRIEGFNEAQVLNRYLRSRRIQLTAEYSAEDILVISTLQRLTAIQLFTKKKKGRWNDIHPEL